jgi:hypothetical protein
LQNSEICKRLSGNNFKFLKRVFGMIIWQGLGILAIVIPLACNIVAQFIVPLIFGTDFAHAGVLINSASLVGAIGVWFLGQRLNGRPSRILLDPETGEQVIWRARHTLFWIPMQYWCFVWVVAALVWWQS